MSSAALNEEALTKAIWDFQERTGGFGPNNDEEIVSSVVRTYLRNEPSDGEKLRIMGHALREILFARKPGPVPKVVEGALIERIENIARRAIERAA